MSSILVKIKQLICMHDYQAKESNVLTKHLKILCIECSKCKKGKVIQLSKIIKF